MQRTPLAGAHPFSLECNSRPSVRSLAKRLHAMAGRDLLRHEGGNADGQGCIGLSLDLALGVPELPRLDSPPGSGSPQTDLITSALIFFRTADALSSTWSYFSHAIQIVPDALPGAF